MKIRIAVVPAAAEDLEGYLPKQSANLVAFLKLHGFLLFDSDKSKAEFLRRATLAGLRPELVSVWAEIIQSRKTSRTLGDGSPSLDVGLEADAIREWEGRTDVLALKRENYDLLAMIPEDLPGHPEICALREIRQTEACENLDALLHASIRLGQSRRDVWAQRFEPYCLAAREVLIADKMLGKQVWEGIGDPKRMRASGYWWVLSLLKRYPIRKVTLGTNLHPSMRPEQLIEGLKTLVDSLQPTYEVRLLHTQYTKWPIHYRHIRFDQDAVYQFEQGFDTCRFPKFRENYPCNWLEMDLALEDYERLLDVAHDPDDGGLLIGA